MAIDRERVVIGRESVSIVRECVVIGFSSLRREHHGVVVAWRKKQPPYPHHHINAHTRVTTPLPFATAYRLIHAAACGRVDLLPPSMTLHLFSATAYCLIDFAACGRVCARTVLMTPPSHTPPRASKTLRVCRGVRCTQAVNGVSWA